MLTSPAEDCHPTKCDSALAESRDPSSLTHIISIRTDYEHNICEASLPMLANASGIFGETPLLDGFSFEYLRPEWFQYASVCRPNLNTDSYVFTCTKKTNIVLLHVKNMFLTFTCFLTCKHRMFGWDSNHILPALCLALQKAPMIGARTGRVPPRLGVL